MSIYVQNKALIKPLRDALYSYDADLIRDAIVNLSAPDAKFRLCYPFQKIDGPKDLWDRVYAPLSTTMQDLIWDMLHDLQKGNTDRPERGLGGDSHPYTFLYGSTGLEIGRGHSSRIDVLFRSFRTEVSNNTHHLDEDIFFRDHNRVAFTGRKSGEAPHSGDGFLGFAPTGKRITQRILNFWRIENSVTHKNWVTVGIFNLYRLFGVDLFARMQAATDGVAA